MLFTADEAFEESEREVVETDGFEVSEEERAGRMLGIEAAGDCGGGWIAGAGKCP